MKGLQKLIIIFAIFIVALMIGKNFIVKAAVESGVKIVTGLPLHIGSLSIGISKTLINIRNLKLYNPSSFSDSLMIHMPEIYVDYELSPLFHNKVHITSMAINLAELVVIKDKDGKVNVNALKQDSEIGRAHV